MTLETAEPQRAGAVPRYARIDVIGGSLMIFIAGLVWYGAINLDLGRVINIGPGALPTGLALLLFIGGAALLLRGLLGRGEGAEPFMFALRPPLILGMAIVLFAIFIRGGDFWIVSTPRLGLMVVGPLAVFIAGFATPEAKPKELLVLAFGLTAAILLVFCDLLSVPLPVFPFAIQNMIPLSFGVDAGVRVLYTVYGALAAVLYVIFFRLPETRRG